MNYKWLSMMTASAVLLSNGALWLPTPANAATNTVNKSVFSLSKQPPLPQFKTGAGVLGAEVTPLGEEELRTETFSQLEKKSKRAKRQALQATHAEQQTYSMSDLNRLSYDELVEVLRKIEWKNIPDLFKFNSDSVEFYSDRDRVQAVINALQDSGRSFTDQDARGISTLVEVLRSGYYLGYYHKELKYLDQSDYKEKVLPAVKTITANKYFAWGNNTQQEVIGATGKLISNTTVDVEIITKMTGLVSDFIDHFDEYGKDREMSSSFYSVIQGIGYVLMWQVREPEDQKAFNGSIDNYLEQMFRIAHKDRASSDLSWLVSNGLYYTGSLGHYHNTPEKGNKILTEAMHLYPKYSELYFVAAEQITYHYNEKNYYGNQIDLKQLKEEGKKKYLPNRYEFDGGKFIFRTGDQLTEEQLQRLYWAAKEVKAQFHRVVGNDQELEKGNPDDVLTVVIYNSPDEYRMNKSLYGYETENGGIYIEGDGTFFTYDRTPEQSIYSLEELFRHEFTHYLQGRYVVPGLFGRGEMYQNGRLPWFEEGGAEFFAGATRTDGIHPRKSVVGNIRYDDRSSRMSVSDTLHAQYGSWNFYNYGFAMQYHLFQNDFSMMDRIHNAIMKNDVAQFDRYIEQLSRDKWVNDAYQQTIDELVQNYEDWDVPLVSDDYLKDVEPKQKEEIYAEISEVTGLRDIETAEHESEFFNTFTLHGTYIGDRSAGEEQDWKKMNQVTDDFLKELSKKSWNGYRTATAYFVNYKITKDGRFSYDVVFHGKLPKGSYSGNLAPVVEINGPYTGVVAESVSFSSKGTRDKDGKIMSYQWDFGDGQTSQEENPTHVYAEAGTYEISLQVTDDAKQKVTKKTTVTISEKANKPSDNSNDSFENASKLEAFGKQIKAELNQKKEEDVFYFDVKKTDNIEVSVEVKNGQGVAWQLFHEDDLKNYIAYPNQGEGDQLMATLEAKPGRYYLYVYSITEEPVSYKYQVSLAGGSKDFAESEPNNRFEDANGPLPLGEPVKGILDEGDNADVYRFELKKESDLEIILKHTKKEGINWLLYHEDDLKNPVSYPVELDKGRMSATYTAEPGLYYLFVYKYEDEVIPYTVSVNK
ncbi:PKD domain-containing protein [Brevibacillus laterosporus]|uniref:microbial collagenase n=1 Tax=Brevibacillus laterosporus LMG 15441 TaxID=1042163 RepID=A0A075R1Q2_BRELA|nr:collagenase [Brevibacillus laterosporus]AIG26517.1 microbial collagenase precursor [Brevibacillus laterosporus LMG 15441]RJL09052.1 PKD domain-containing protein [Brevibacillus laterosporus]TPH10537.1 PKD domain-containing protein [Brevibacillus laterosporus]